MARIDRFCIVASLVLCACDRNAARTDAAGGSRPPRGHSIARDSTRLAEARAAVEARYAAHWRTAQGFSRDTLRARETWFTPTLYHLLLADMSGPELGALDHDPFADAQDVATRYVVGNPRASHDTVYVPVQVGYEPAGEAPHHVTLAMLGDAAGWRIADFVDAQGSLATRLRANPPETSGTGSVPRDRDR